MERRCLLCLLWLLCRGLLGHLAAGMDVQCSDRQYAHEGRCCSRCAPGQKVIAACIEESGVSKCAPCEEGYFQAHWTKENHCMPHSYCDSNAGLVVKTPGDEKQDVTCGCQVGMHCTSAQCQTCRLNPLCKPGFGAVPKAQEDTPPMCQPCPDGSFSSVTSDSKPCQPWSRCEDQGLVMKENGTRSSDVVCESQRSRSRSPSLVSVLIPILAGTCALGLFLFCLYHRGFQRLLQKQDTVPLKNVKVDVDKPRPEPSEEDEMPSEQNIPVQETTEGGQPVAQEDGKESHISERERP